jgi:hypothetical protein
MRAYSAALNMSFWNGWTAGFGLMATALLTAGAGPDSGAADASVPDAAVLVGADGSVCWVTEAFGSRSGQGRQPVRYDFGLPDKKAQRRWLENETLPICHTICEKNGIRYTQNILLTRLGPGDLMTDRKLPVDAVLLVQIVGENFTNEYAEASAALAMEVGGQKLNLELREGLVFAGSTNAPVLAGAIDIAAAGIAGAKGSTLRFRGNMPPGNTGAMTIKIPLGRLRDNAAIERLRDLEFDGELRRVKQFWGDHGKSGGAGPLPVVLARPE